MSHLTRSADKEDTKWLVCKEKKINVSSMTFNGANTVFEKKNVRRNAGLIF